MTVRTIEAQPAEKKKLRVAAYCRVSTDNDDQRESLETQKAHYEEWIKLHSDWEYAGVFYMISASLGQRQMPVTACRHCYTTAASVASTMC